MMPTRLYFVGLVKSHCCKARISQSLYLRPNYFYVFQGLQDMHVRPHLRY
jgi:hypothetical protein